MIALFRCLIVAAFTLSVPNFTAAHALDPGYLSLTEREVGNWDVFFRKPDVKGREMDIEARLPENCVAQSAMTTVFDGAAWSADWRMHCPEGVTGKAVAIDGLESQRTDVLLRISALGKSIQTVRLTPANTTYLVPANFSVAQVFTNYLLLGYEHILEGFDHLLFVFALLLLVQTPRKLFWAITAFTLAHSITLALASLGFLSVPAPPVEAIIALSITFLALEIIRRKEGVQSLTQQFPWMISFAFGLLHGLGFAGALSEIGLPEGDIPIALLSFNIGVELGQLTFVLAALGVFAILSMTIPKFAKALRGPRTMPHMILGYAVGAMSIYWLMERVTSFPIFSV